MFINKEKIKLILMILMFILALGLFSYFLNPTTDTDQKSKTEGFQMNSNVVNIADIQGNLIYKGDTEPLPNYQPDLSMTLIDISKNHITTINPRYYLVDGSLTLGGNIAQLPTGTTVVPFPNSMPPIPSGYFKYTHVDNKPYLAQVPAGYYIVNTVPVTMARLPVYGSITPPIADNTIPDGYYMTMSTSQPSKPGLALFPSGYYQIDNTTMAKFPTGDIVSPAPIPGIKIPHGYYTPTISGTKWLAEIPYGYRYAKLADGVTDDPENVVPYSNTAIQNFIAGGNVVAGSKTNSTLDPSYNYDSNNYNVNYHDSVKTILSKEDSNLVFGPNLNADGVSVSFPQHIDPIYYTPGSFVFGASNYVPNYEDSVYLSRTTGLSTISMAVPSKSVLGGFCASTDKTAIEQKCNSIPVDQCASTSCCVVLGGAKCVSGNEMGPTMKSNYTDPTIVNKDYYYYQGKCYGFCN